MSISNLPVSTSPRKCLNHNMKIAKVKLPAHRAWLPRNEISFFIVPLDPTYKAGLAGHLPVTP
jgi:hypothetical protein